MMNKKNQFQTVCLMILFIVGIGLTVGCTEKKSESSETEKQNDLTVEDKQGDSTTADKQGDSTVVDQQDDLTAETESQSSQPQPSSSQMESMLGQEIEPSKSEDINDSKQYISKKFARKLALIEMETNREIQGWEGASLKKEPILIYGSDGKPRHYEFRVVRDGENIGVVTMNAKKG